MIPDVSNYSARASKTDINMFINDPNCLFCTQYSNQKLGNLIEECLKTVTTSLKNNKDMIKKAKEYHNQFSEGLDILLDFLNLKRTDSELKRLILYIAEAVRLLSECKDVLKGLSDKNKSINYIFDNMMYLNNLVKIQSDKTSMNTLKSNVKTFRNFIFSKIPIKRKDFIEDFLVIVDNTRTDEAMLIDNLRVLAKISELEKIASRIAANTITYSIIDNILNSKSDYVIGGCLQLIGNCLAVNAEFGSRLYTPKILENLLKLFERYCNKVS